MKVKKSSLLSSATVFSSVTLISRVTGFMRDIIIATMFGATPVADAFFVAFKIPNFMRRLVAEGAFTQAFVPLLADFQHKGESQTKKIIGVVWGTLASATFAITVLGVLLAPFLVTIFAPGYATDSDPARLNYASDFLRVTFPYLFFISMTAFCGAVLNGFGYYAAPAFSPVWLNISMIGGAWYLSGYFDIGVWGLVWGVLIAGVLQNVFLLPFMYRNNFLSGIRVDWHDPVVRKILLAMLPALFGVSIAQLNLLMDTAFASFLENGSVSWLYFSDRLMNFPLGIIGIAVSTVSLPNLSRHAAARDSMAFSNTLHWAIRIILLTAVPSMLGLILLAKPIIVTLFMQGSFLLNDAFMTSKSLQMFSLGLPAFMLVKVLASAFFAQKDYRTPVVIGGIALIVNLVFNLMLIKPMAHAGLALSTSIAAYVNAGLLLFILNKKNIYNPYLAWIKFGAKLLLAALLMLLFLYLCFPDISQWILDSKITNILKLSAIIVIASIIYLLTLFSCGLRYKDIKGLSE